MHAAFATLTRGPQSETSSRASRLRTGGSLCQHDAAVRKQRQSSQCLCDQASQRKLAVTAMARESLLGLLIEEIRLNAPVSRLTEV